MRRPARRRGRRPPRVDDRSGCTASTAAAPSPGHRPRHRGVGQPGGELLDQAGLADPGLAADHHRPPGRPRRGGGVEQGGEVAVASDEGEPPGLATAAPAGTRGAAGDAGTAAAAATAPPTSIRRAPGPAQGSGPRAGGARRPDRCRPPPPGCGGRRPARRRRAGGRRYQGQGQLGSQALPEGMVGDGSLDPGEEGVVVADGEASLEAVLQHLGVEPVEAHDGLVDEHMTGELRQRRPDPDRRASSRWRRSHEDLPTARRRGRPGQVLEPGGVDHVRGASGVAAGWVTSRRAGSRGFRSGSSARRRFEMYACSDVSGFAGGSSPQTCSPAGWPRRVGPARAGAAKPPVASVRRARRAIP